MGEHAATIDIGNEQHWAIHGLGKSHIGDIPIAQINFRGAARAFD